MDTFEDFKLSKQFDQALKDLGFNRPTPIQAKAYPLILSGKDVVGIAQTGTGKTFAYILPLLRDLKHSTQVSPRVLILVPTRELVIQLVEQIDSLTKNTNIRVLGIYGGVNINTQKQKVAEGCDILISTPGRLYDLVISGSINLKTSKKVVIDEVDVMLDLGFRFQLTNIFDHLPGKKQSLMFSATMTEEVDALIDDFFIAPTRIAIALSGTPLDNIDQKCYRVQNFYTKVNLLIHLLNDRETFQKVLVFSSSKKNADRLFAAMEEKYGMETGVIHANKSQNYRIRAVKKFDSGLNRILLATDIIARGLDLNKVSHVINFDTPTFPENYMHRIGRTGRAEQEGKSILFFTEKENESKEAIEELMDYKIPIIDFPDEVGISKELIPDERPREISNSPHKNIKPLEKGAAFHEKKEKNKKTNQGGSYLRKKKQYKKPQTRGDKIMNQRSKKR